jgi:hypothetical protein
VAWLAAGLEGLDDDHAAAAAGARVRERLRRIAVTRRLGGVAAGSLPPDPAQATLARD